VYSIGEFSKVTGLSVKTLRFYHDEGLLVPSCVDPATGYRYYAETKVDTARVITQLRALDFSLADIGEILTGHDDEADILDYLERQRNAIRQKLQQHRQIEKFLDQIITREREARTIMKATSFQVEEKVVDAMLIAGVRMRGKYSDCGQGFARVSRKFGRHICGKPLLLHYDMEYKESDADFEACLPIKNGASADGIDVRDLPGGRCVTLLHQGPYDDLGRSYAKLLEYIKQKGYHVQTPTREVYLKGPGMILKGNPKKYLTEIQMLIDGAETPCR
jgi:DNA-binding transcriptional MerR regulator/effector-binding domain-containing protein